MSAAPLPFMKVTRDPATDPQPGDVALAGDQTRRVLKVRGGKLFIQATRTRFLINLPTWREWCRKTSPHFHVEHNRQ